MPWKYDVQNLGLLLVLVLLAPVTGGVDLGGPQGELANRATKGRQPQFDTSIPRNVTALIGKSAYLTCKVYNLANKTVSWIRHRDLHILTVADYTYTSDQRFQATHHKESEEWTLHVKRVQKRDSGMYECQVSTQPITSYFVYLNVIGNDMKNGLTQAWSPYSRIAHQELMYSDQVPTASIHGGPEVHVARGDTINLTCSVRFSPKPPSYITWYHLEEIIQADKPQPGVTVETMLGEVTTSTLLVRGADLPDSGKYTCMPSNADETSVNVYVLNGESPAAMKTNAGVNFCCNYIILFVCVLIYMMR